MIYTTNAVEALNRSLRKIIKTRGSFPNDDAARLRRPRHAGRSGGQGLRDHRTPPQDRAPSSRRRGPQRRPAWATAPRSGTTGTSSARRPRRQTLDRAPPRPRCPTSPHAPREPSSARVDAALPLDKFLQCFGIRLVRRGVPQGPAPLTPGSFVCSGRVRGATDDRGEGVFTIRHLQPTQSQSPASSVNFLALRRPHGHQGVHGAEVGVNRVPVSVGLGVFPGGTNPLQILPQGCRRVGNRLLPGAVWPRCR
jgi:hypothetical protein